MNKRAGYEDILKQNNLKYKLSKEIKEGNMLSVIWIVQGNAKNHEQFINAIYMDDSVIRFEY